MLDEKSKKRLEGVDERLQRVVEKAREKAEFIVVEGLRTVERQQELVSRGASKTMKSKHLIGKAVDLAPTINGEVKWDWPLFYPLARVVKEAAKELNVEIVWGGDWKTFKDGPHWELM